MKFGLPILAASFLATACASSPPTTPAPSLTSVKESEAPKKLAAKKSTSIAKEDISQTSKWTAVEVLWPETPYMALSNTLRADKEVYGLSFNCNTDTGALSGALQNQPKENSGKAASFSLRTSDGEAMTLLGMYAKNTSTNSTDFVFTTDWRAMKAISKAERVDFIDPNGVSQIALVKKQAPHRGDTMLLASSDNFEDTQVELYYYCNPK